MNNLCDLCLRDISQCENQIAPCNYIPKYNLCPICKESTVIYEQKCYKCGYDFKVEGMARDWRKPRNKRELSPEKLFNIIASVDGEKRAIEKMMDLGFDVSQWIKEVLDA